MIVSESLEDYLETILVLQQRKGTVQSIDVAVEMGLSKPSVSVAVRKLKEKLLIEVDERHRLLLTETGKAVAERTYERHKMFAQMLSSMGVNEETAVQDACRMEHVVSDESFAAMKKFFARIGQFESV